MTAVAVGALLIVRRRAPDGSHFHDGDRAAGVFGVLATGFAILLGFVVFLAFESFDHVAQRRRIGGRTSSPSSSRRRSSCPLPVRARLSGELVCYGRTVVSQEWPEMERATPAAINPWGFALFRR